MNSPVDVIERYLFVLSPRARSSEVCSEVECGYVLRRDGKTAPILTPVLSTDGFFLAPERVLAAVEHASWMLDRVNDLVVGVAGKWRRWGR